MVGWVTSVLVTVSDQKMDMLRLRSAITNVRPTTRPSTPDTQVKIEVPGATTWNADPTSRQRENAAMNNAV